MLSLPAMTSILEGENLTSRKALSDYEERKKSTTALAVVLLSTPGDEERKEKPTIWLFSSELRTTARSLD